MAKVYLTVPAGANVATPEGRYFNEYPCLRLRESYGTDVHGTHELTDDPAEADVILLASNTIFFPAGLGLLREDLFRKYSAKVIVYDRMFNPSPFVGGLSPNWVKGNEPFPGAGQGWMYYHPGAAEPHLEQLAWSTPVPYLWSFKGDHRTHPVRDSLLRVKDERAFVRDTSATSQVQLRKHREQTDADKKVFIEQYINLIRDSKFVVCPRGVGASSMRLFEAMRAGRAPVIISDDWLPPLFVDWAACSLRVPESAAGRIGEILREHESEAEALGARAREEWERVYGPANQFHHAVETCLRILEARRRAGGLRKYAALPKLLRAPYNRELMRYAKKRVWSK